MSNRQVVFVINSLRAGGAERVASLLVNYIHKTTPVRVEVVTLDSRRYFYSLPEGVDVVCVPGYRFSIGILRLPMMAWQAIWLTLRVLIKYSRSSDVTLVGFLHRANVVASTAAYITGKRVILSERSLFSASYKGMKARIMKRILIGAYALPSRIIAISSAAKNSLVSQLNVNADRINTINNPSFIQSRYRTAAPSEICSLLFVGRLVKSKNVDFLLRGLARLNFGLSTYKLTIVGEGPELQSLVAAAEAYGVAESVAFAGASHDVLSHYEAADIFVFASDYESFGNVLIEAASTGLPVVTSDQQDGRQDIFPDDSAGAVFYSAEDVSSFVNAVCYLSNGDAWLKVSEAATRNAERFRLTSIMSEYVDEILR
ncbi:glycosyltransferase [Aromatoleum bremense]|uniref:Glycosyltransferase n=1 Tax=Aromatoleum bremense TaxID=76115 RepID=A0ABX1NY16_9RHOO|nr:glycosyltransferase [Aromatoleum bremense]NMG16646.1 glycosyltransferase [Aromatoleum bremense]QTQ33521.1 Glycosyl transferase, family I [Aromatoleum bremense]